jgi:hypothetical protein
MNPLNILCPVLIALGMAIVVNHPQMCRWVGKKALKAASLVKSHCDARAFQIEVGRDAYQASREGREYV